MDGAFKFIIQNHGINTEASYPYKGVDGKSNIKEEAVHAATITGYEDVPINNEKALQKAVANQPVSVAIDASGADFQFSCTYLVNSFSCCNSRKRPTTSYKINL